MDEEDDVALLQLEVQVSRVNHVVRKLLQVRDLAPHQFQSQRDAPRSRTKDCYLVLNAPQLPVLAGVVYAQRLAHNSALFSPAL